MEGFNIEVLARDEAGSAGARRVRREGNIPAVIFHRHEDSINAVVNYNSFLHLAERAKPSQIFTFVSQDERLNGRSALVKDIQKDYVSGKLLHVDFQALRDDEEISVEVSLKIIGEAPGVKIGGGILSVVRHSLMVTCLPKDIPLSIDVSVAELQLNETIFTGDIALPEGVTFRGDEEEPVVSVVAPSAEEEATPASAEGAAAGGAEAAKTPDAPAAKK